LVHLHPNDDPLFQLVKLVSTEEKLVNKPGKWVSIPGLSANSLDSQVTYETYTCFAHFQRQSSDSRASNLDLRDCKQAKSHQQKSAAMLDCKPVRSHPRQDLLHCMLDS